MKRFFDFIKRLNKARIMAEVNSSESLCSLEDIQDKTTDPPSSQQDDLNRETTETGEFENESEPGTPGRTRSASESLSEDSPMEEKKEDDSESAGTLFPLPLLTLLFNL